jgi:hypothetical protein
MIFKKKLPDLYCTVGGLEIETSHKAMATAKELIYFCDYFQKHFRTNIHI